MYNDEYLDDYERINEFNGEMVDENTYLEKNKK